MISKIRRTSLDVAKTMPPLRHTVGDQFDINTSEVVNWLIKQPQVRQYIFRTTSAAGLIVYDPATGTWSGKNHTPGATPKKWEFT